MLSTRSSPCIGFGNRQIPLLSEDVGPKIRGLATGASHGRTGAASSNVCPISRSYPAYGVGYDNVDISEAVRRGIVVTNTPDVLNDEVADLPSDF